jgi:putative hemolysin
MKNLYQVLFVILLSACHSGPTVETNIRADKNNPASVFCQQQGGKLSLIKNRNGVTGYCTLPDGELIEEWELYKRYHG